MKNYNNGGDFMKKTNIKKAVMVIVSVFLILSMFSLGTFAKSKNSGKNGRVVTGKNTWGWEICVDYYYDANNSKYYEDLFQKRANAAKFIWEAAVYKVPPTSAKPIEGMIRLGGFSFKINDLIAQSYANTCYKGRKKSGIIIHTYMNMVIGIDLQ